METTKHIYINRGWIILYALLAIILVPWVFNLAYSLPEWHIARHWDAAWTGFDAGMVLMILLTIYFAVKKQVWVIITTTALATLFLVDAWFDILTSRPGQEQRTALFFGIVEVLLAILSFKLVHHVVKHSTSHDRVKLVPKPKLAEETASADS